MIVTMQANIKSIFKRCEEKFNGLGKGAHTKIALKWLFIIAGIYILDVWILASLAAGFLKSTHDAIAVFKQTPGPDIPGAGWYFTHPFKTAWAYFLHTFGAPISVPEVYSAWIKANILAIGLGVTVYLNRKYKTDKNSVQGSSKFTSQNEAKNYLAYDYVPGIMFGAIKNVKLRPAVLKMDAPGNRNVAVFGPPGSMKTAGYIKNNLFQAVKSGWSVIITDPKGELVKDYAAWFEKKGYTVKIFNLVSMLNSDRWNPLSEVYDDISAQHFCNVVIANTEAPGRKEGDPFWDNAETNLLKALVMYVTTELPIPNRNLGELYSLLACGDSKQLDGIFAGLPENHPAKLPYNLFCEASGTVRAGVIMGLGNRLGVFQNLLVRELTAVYDQDEQIDLELPGREKCAYFCILSDTDSTFNFLASLYFSFLFIKLTKLADRQPKGTLIVPVNFLLDEFCNISGIPDFTKKLSTMRGRGIACSIIFQNVPQLEQAYPNRTWEIILGDCDYWLLLGAKELATSDYMSKTLGNATVRVEQDTRSKGIKGINPFDGNIRTGPIKRLLMDASEVGRLNVDESILRLSDGQVMKLKKMLYINHPWAKELIERHIEDYQPPWAQDFVNRVPGVGAYSDTWPTPEESEAHTPPAPEVGNHITNIWGV